MSENANISIAEQADYCSFIDGWRGIAILLVVAVHTSQLVGNDGNGIFLFKYTESFLNSGARGVQLFYILSAFTLFNSSFRRFKVDSNPRLSFYLRRCFRIVPLWWLAVVLFCILKKKTLVSGLLNGSFLFGFFRFNPSLEVVPGGWSLFVEETFYLLLPVIFGKITNLKKASTFTIALILLAVVWSGSQYLKLPVPTSNDFVFLFPFNHWYIFGIGIMMYYIIRQHKFQNSIRPDQRWMFDLAAFAGVPVLITSYLSLISVMFAFCIYVSSCQGTIFNKIVNSKILMRFGVYCYSIYLLQFLVLHYSIPYLKSVFEKIGIQNAVVEVKFILAFSIVSFLCLIVGFCCFNLIEKPSVKLGKQVILMINSRINRKMVLEGLA